MRRTSHWSMLPIVALVALSARATADPVKDAAAARTDIKQTFGFVPNFLQAVPDVLLPAAWEEMKTLHLNSSTALSNKQKELIGLAVSAQVPCEYCTYAHTEFAKLNGATQAEIGEAVAIAGLTRHWSTFLNGTMPDEARFKGDLVKSVEHVKKVQAGKSPTQVIAVVDASSAHRDIAQWYGPIGDHLKKFPPEAMAAAWRGLKDVDLATTALDSKTKALISVAVAAQIPCRYCVLVDTEFAKLAGASDRELMEAIAMASFIRQMSTVVNGMQVDKVRFKQDIARIVKAAKRPEAKTPKSARR